MKNELGLSERVHNLREKVLSTKGEIQMYRSKLKLWDWNDLKKEQFYKSVEIGIKALQTYIHRFEALAMELTGKVAPIPFKSEI